MAKKIVNPFQQQIMEWSKTGKMPMVTGQDLNHCLALQRNRLQKHNLEIEYDLWEPTDAIIKGDAELDRGRNTNKKLLSNKYENITYFRSSDKRTIFRRAGEKIYDKEGAYMIYATMTNVKHDRITGHEPVNCPNCGGISTIGKISEGCEYCGSRFRVQELFPKVTDYYYYDQGKLAPHVRMKYLGLSIFLAVALAALLGLAANFLLGGIIGLENVVLILGFFLVSCVIGALLLYIIIIGAKTGERLKVKRVEKAATDYTADEFYKINSGDPNFSFGLFLNQLITKVKTITYSDNPMELSIFEGKRLNPAMGEIVEMDYGRQIEFCGAQIKDGYAHVNLKLHMECLHDVNGGLEQRHDIFGVAVTKNITIPETPGFSIKLCTCKNCGASFDATKLKHCPYCSTEYDIRDDDWVITDLMLL